MSFKVAIIDFGMGNLFSIHRACEFAGIHAVLTHTKTEVARADGLILPGVGAFGDAMKHLKELDLIDPIKESIRAGKPFLGICLGMQLLMSQSEEFGVHKGLDIIKGDVVRFPSQTKQAKKIKVPQVGWNQVWPSPKDADAFAPGSVLKELSAGEYMYFVHSFYVRPQDPSLVASVTNYEGVEYCSSLQKDNIFAVQYHPEKSSKAGLQLYKNWASTARASVVKE